MNVTILGCGEYGLALANVFLEKSSNHVCVWNKFEREILKVQEKYLTVRFTTDLSIATRDADLIVIAIPVAFLEETMKTFKDIYAGQEILIASKGIDIKNQCFAYEIVRKYLNDAPLGVISGGTFAKDMQAKKVMGITLGTRIDSIKDKVKKGFETKFLRVQYIDDMLGVSVCGSIKNVMAIGFGLLDGAKFPPSSKFLFLTEAIYEIRDLIKVLGGDVNTIMSYAGIDDIMMTCTSSESRNYTLGYMIGSNKSSEDINTYKANTTIEGLGTSEAIYKLAKAKNITLPITSVIYRILYENADINELINLLEKRES
jgi:glycerol-3-phosphate dehydrogenase (NAD(P)+)